MSQKLLPNTIDDKEIKVENPILDLNEMKNQMYQESSQTTNTINNTKDPLRKTNTTQFQQTSYSTQSAFANTKPLVPLQAPIKPTNEY